MIVMIGITWLVYEKLWVQDKEIGYLQHIKQSVNGKSIYFFSMCALLAPFNWLFESKKWQELVAPFQEMSFKQTASAILTGITLGVLTPSRLGEYGGRLLHIKEGNRGRALYAHFMGSLSQNIPILLLGAISCAIYFSKHYLESELLGLAISSLILLLTVLLITLYLQNDFITKKIFEHKYITKYAKGFVPTQYSKSTLQKVAIFSLLRYMIYVSQYLFLLYCFGINVSITEGLIGVCVIFLFQTGLPLPPALSVLARTELALIIWSVYSSNQLSILTVPILLWMINLLVPAIMGSIIILSTNFQKQMTNV